MSDLPPLPPPPPPAGGIPPPPPMPGTPGSSPADSVPIGEAFGYGWRKFTANIGPWILLALALVVISLLGLLLRAAADSLASGFGATLLSLFFSVGILVLQYAVSYGLVRASLAVTNGQAPNPGNAWQLDQFGPYIVASILVGIVVGVGLLLCVIPGLIAQFLLWFTPFFVIDRNMAPVDAMKASYATTSKHVGGLLGFILVSMLVMFAGVLVCGLGVLVAYPVVLVATAFVYKRMTGQAVAA